MGGRPIAYMPEKAVASPWDTSTGNVMTFPVDLSLDMMCRRSIEMNNNGAVLDW